jgi:hypothetical protein
LVSLPSVLAVVDEHPAQVVVAVVFRSPYIKRRD